MLSACTRTATALGHHLSHLSAIAHVCTASSSGARSCFLQLAPTAYVLDECCQQQNQAAFCRLLEVDLAAALLHLAPYLQQHYPAASQAPPAAEAPASQQVQALGSPAHPSVII